MASGVIVASATISGGFLVLTLKTASNVARVTNYDLSIAFDTTQLSFADFTGLPGGLSAFNVIGGKLAISAAADAGVAPGGTVGTVRFNVLTGFTTTHLTYVGTANDTDTVPSVGMDVLSDAPLLGLPVIIGTATEDQILTANVAPLSDADGIASYAYQWLRDGNAIATATASTYQLTDADVGHRASVKVTVTDIKGNTGFAVSAASGTVANINDLPQGSVTISGQAAQNQTLAANTASLSDDDGLGTFSYQWFAGGNAVGTNAATLLLTQAHVGKAVSVRVTYTDGHGTFEQVQSASTGAVANVNDAPQGGVQINGILRQNETLTVSNTLSDADGMGTVTYQWMSGADPIAGATGTSLLLTQANVGKVLWVTASYTDGFGTRETVSAGSQDLVQNVNDAPTGRVTIAGFAAVGKTLTASNTLADLDGLGTIRYEWYAGTAKINGATANTYLLTDAELGKTITAKAVYTDGFGTDEAVASAPTAAVTPPFPTVQGDVYHWKSHALLQNVSVSMLDATAVRSSSDLFDLRGLTYDKATGAATVQVWVNPQAAAGSLDFTLDAVGATSMVFTSSLSGDWSVRANQPSGTRLVFGSINGNTAAGGAKGALHVGDLALAFPQAANGFKLEFSNVAVGEATVDYFGVETGTQVSSASGHLTFGQVQPSTYSFSATRAATDSGNAVNSADALAALRIAVNVNPNPVGANGALKVSPYQVIAADVDEDGKVTSADALAILRMAVQLPTAPAQKWLMVDERLDLWNRATDSSLLTADSAAWQSATLMNVQKDATVNYVAVLKGDVNGNWAAPEGSADLDVTKPTYFQALGTVLGVPTDVWGI